jgi:DNA-binding MarR family transcriptional regulator
MDVTELDLTTLVTLTAPALTSTVVERLAEEGFAGVKASHGYVVQRLLAGEPTIGALARSLGMTQQGASKQVADLTALGYAERVAVAADQRARTVRLTDRGRAMVEATRRIRADLEQQVLTAVGADDATATRRTLTALVEVLGLTDRVARRSVPEPG